MAPDQKPDGKPLLHNLRDGDPASSLSREPGADPAGSVQLPSRRDILKLAGFAFAGATLGGCERVPVEYLMAPSVQPEGLVAGRSYDYASTCGGCTAGCGLLVKVRDGRPIKLEGNPEHPLSRGGLCAAGQASLLGLYDQQRLQQPLIAGQPATWQDADEAIRTQLDEIRRHKGAVRFVTGSVTSPTTRELMQRFLDGFPDARHVVCDPGAGSAILAAHERTHGARCLPHFHFDKARIIVSFGADFLGRWISPVEFAAAYQAGRRLDGPSPSPSHHVQFESRLSLTGSKADRRLLLAPGEVGLVMSDLASRLAGKAGIDLGGQPLPKGPVPDDFLNELADHLWQNRQHSLVVSDSQDVGEQVLCNFLNHVLGNYGATVSLAEPSHQHDANDPALEQLLHEVRSNHVQALFIYQCNPVHDLPGGADLVDAWQRIPLVVSCAERLDETARAARIVCPVPHYLESWGDTEPVSGLAGVVQPAIAPLAETRSIIESLAAWMGTVQTAHDLVRAHWQSAVFPRWRGGGTFQDFWDKAVHDGFVRLASEETAVNPFQSDEVRLLPRVSRPPEGTYSLVLYSKVGMPDASHAYNPWLQELPDPVSKVTWDNYACLSPTTADRLGLVDGDVIQIDARDGESPTTTIELPVLVQRGQHDDIAAVALGYGSRLSERFAGIGPRWLQAGATVGADGLVGKNAAGLATWVDGSLRWVRDGVRLSKTGRQQPLAATQSYNLLDVPAHLALAGQERRPVIRETTVANLRHEADEAANRRSSEPAVTSAPAAANNGLWPDDHAASGPRWGMAIDLNACNGCSACVVACQVENNIPVVGKDEVRRHREMYWMRIDRYYTEQDGALEVAHQPMLCQHCGNAPCETVCPVLATVHSDDGLNQQVYNRCVGTRYCANNCPYKVRRFNWFDYAHDDILQNLVLNPDVTVRSRGVMEKCTFCVQRIADARGAAGGRDERIADGAVRTACQQSCPAQAIVFGDLNDPDSRVAQLTAGPRSYRVLEELNIRPSVSYLAIVRDRPAETDDKDSGHG